eukprot:CAMPEP_0198128106 /NCGR_PEP_ID=MMETSP1442-20131203/48584_1 /TAXON_ID= /ORGANISM="Craspedostauros australis, Strain CCMP3328" /LENGTH=178 /DNA_ID=CAMNT_0043788199 /DNA_START=152 /DNA_END=685 /DNA_ORIENTATION=-
MWLLYSSCDGVNGRSCRRDLLSSSASRKVCRKNVAPDPDAGKDVQADRKETTPGSFQVVSVYYLKFAMGRNRGIEYSFHAAITKLKPDTQNQHYEVQATFGLAHCTCTSTHVVEQVHDDPGSCLLTSSYVIMPNNCVGKLFLGLNKKRLSKECSNQFRGDVADLCTEAVRQTAMEEST